MNSRDRELERRLDRALEDIRASTPLEAQARAAEERVWARLQAEAESASAPAIRSCADFQKLIPAYVAGALGDSRRWLLEDHLGECVPCRRAFREQRKSAPAPAAAPRRRWSKSSRWMARGAAAAAAFVAVVGIHVKTDVFSFETGGMVHVDRVEGELFRVTEAGLIPVAQGESLTLDEGRHIRTAQDSTAVLRLADESRVEMRERSELAVQNKRFLLPGRRTDGVIDLVRGSVIVEASDQGSGHLFLRTDDCDVSVTGTVFSVNHGVKGSRVSVIEGEVRVAHAGEQNVLRPGQQATTNPALARVAIAEEISWSADRERYVALLAELRSLGDEIDQIFRPGLRYSTNLLDRVPAETAIYFAMPNLSGELSQAYEVFRERVAGNALLEEWWTTQVDAEHAAHLEQAIAKIAAYGEHLGEEVVLALVTAPSFDDSRPVFLAELEDPGAFLEMIEQEIAALPEDDARELRIVEGELPADLATATAQHEGVIFWMRGNLLVVSPVGEGLVAVDRSLRESASTLAGSAFHDQLAAPYRQGVEWLLGVDLSRLIQPEEAEARDVLGKLGILDARFAIGERRQIADHTENRLVLSFSGPRQKLAAWLDEPGPLGALDYVSPDAKFVLGFATKDMEVIVGELFESLSSIDGFSAELATFEREHGIDLRRDLAAALGGEFVLALDGPVLPKPAFALITEVYDPVKLDRALERFVNEFNDLAGQHGMAGFEIDAVTIGGREFRSLRSIDSGLEMHYLYDDGYGLFATSRGQIERALLNRAAGVRLVDSPEFQRLLPQDAQSDFSGLIYQDLGSELAAFAVLFGDDVAPTDVPLDAAPAMLAVFYGEEDSISAVVVSPGGLFSSGFGSSLATLTGLGGLLSAHHQIVESVHSAPRPGV